MTIRRLAVLSLLAWALPATAGPSLAGARPDRVARRGTASSRGDLSPRRSVRGRLEASGKAAVDDWDGELAAALRSGG